MQYNNPLFNSQPSQAVYPAWIYQIFNINGQPSNDFTLDNTIREGITSALNSINGTGILGYLGFNQPPQQLIEECVHKLRFLILLETVRNKARIGLIATELGSMAIYSRLCGHAVNAGGPNMVYGASTQFSVDLNNIAMKLKGIMDAHPNPLAELEVLVNQNKQPASSVYGNNFAFNQPAQTQSPYSAPTGVVGTTADAYASSLVGGTVAPTVATSEPLDDGMEEYVHHNADGTTTVRRRSIKLYAAIVADLQKRGVELTAENVQNAMANSRPEVIPVGGVKVSSAQNAYVTALTSTAGEPDLDWDTARIYCMDEFEELTELLNLRSNAIRSKMETIDEQRDFIDNTRTANQRRKKAMEDAKATGQVIYFDHVGRVLQGVDGATAYHDWLESQKEPVKAVPDKIKVHETPIEPMVSDSFGGIDVVNDAFNEAATTDDGSYEMHYGAGTPVVAPEAVRPLRIPKDMQPGLPSKGMLDALEGKTPTMEDYQTPSTMDDLDQHIGDAVTYEDEDDVDQVLFGDLDTEESDKPEPVDPLVEKLPEHLRNADFDTLMQASAEAGNTITPPVLEQVWEDIPKELRRAIIRANRLIVPVYLRGVEEIIMSTIKDVITLEVRKIVDREAHVIRNKIASWDSSANDVEKGKDLLNIEYQTKVVTADDFVKTLNSELEKVGDDEGDLALAHTLETAPMVSIEGALTTSGDSNEYQYEVGCALANRGVTKSQITNILQSAVVSYLRCETSHDSISAEQADIIYAIRDSQTAEEVVSNVNVYRSSSPETMREISRSVRKFNKLLNQLISVHLGAGWDIVDYYEDIESLKSKAIIDLHGRYEEDEVVSLIDKAFITAAGEVFNLIDTEEGEEESAAAATLSNVVLLPIYHTQYPIYASDKAAKVEKETHPEIHNFLTNVDKSDSVVTKLITLDNVVLTFVTCDDDHYLVEITE